MRCLVTSARPYDREALDRANGGRHDLTYVEASLRLATAGMAQGFGAVCPFVDDCLDAETIGALARGGARLLALRSTGYNHVNLEAASRHGLTVMRVRDYSPHSVAEFAVGMMLTLNRRLHRAWSRVREGNFLLDGLLGFDMYEKTVGIVGTGRIGLALARILAGMGCRLLGYDNRPNPDCEALGMTYLSLEELLRESQIVSLHLPLNDSTFHLMNAARLALLPRGAMIINTSRGGLVETSSLIEALKSGQIGYAGLDVYEAETSLYFRDHGEEVIADDSFERLLTFPNVLVTGHQAFFTREALSVISQTTIANLSDFEAGRTNENVLGP
ncbi:MAG: 2-hydroxyacid dehydrogenase [Leptospirillia bacterium]